MVFRSRRVVGLDNAAREAWYQQSIGNASTNLRRDAAANVTYCHSQLYDSDNVAYTNAAFSNNGLIMAASTSTGIIRLIGLQALRCHYSIDTAKPYTKPSEEERSEHMDFKPAYEHTETQGDHDIGRDELTAPTAQNKKKLTKPRHSSVDCPSSLSAPQPTSSPATLQQPLVLSNHFHPSHSFPTQTALTHVDHLEFVDFDQKLSCISSNHLLVYELIPRVSELVRINLKEVFDSVCLTLLYSEPPPFSKTERDTGNGSSRSSRDSSSGPKNSSSSHHSIPHSRKAPVPTKYPSNMHSIACFCKVLRLIFSTEKQSQVIQVDFVIAFTLTPPMVPIRLLYDILERRVISVSPILTQDELGDNFRMHSTTRDVSFPLVIFPRRYQDWTFDVDRSSGIMNDHMCVSTNEQELLRQSIRTWNSSLRLGEESNVRDFSVWGRDERDLTRVFCAVGVTRGIVLLELFADPSIPSRLLACMHFGSNSSTSAGLIVNRRGTLLVSRSNDRISLIQITEEGDEGPVDSENFEFDNSDRNNAATGPYQMSPSRFSTDQANQRRLGRPRSMKFYLRSQFCYSDAVQRERFDCATFCDGPLKEEMFLICSVGATPAVHFFDTGGRSGVQALVSKIDVTKAGGLKLIIWRPGSPMWAGLSAKRGCLFLFAPPPVKHIWAVMTPDFEYLEKNREILETEEEFDDLVWLHRQKQWRLKNQQEDKKTNLVESESKATKTASDEDEFSVNMWYPFFGPDNCTTEQQERSVQNTDDKETKTASSNDLNCSVTDLYISLLTSRQRKLRKKEHERYQQNKTTNERETLSHGGSVWLTHDELVKEKYRSSLNFQ